VQWSRYPNLTSTPLKRGVKCREDTGNLFNGFPHTAKTVETVSASIQPPRTPLKRGVNQRCASMIAKGVKYLFCFIEALDNRTLFRA